MRERRECGGKQNGKTDVGEVTDAVTKRVQSETSACDGSGRKGERGGGAQRYRLRGSSCSSSVIGPPAGPPAFPHCAPGEVLGHGPFTH